MPANPDSTLFDSLTPIQVEVLKALAAGATITAAALEAGVHRSTVHLWTRNHPAFARTLLSSRQHRAEALLDELTDLHELALDTFRQLLSDPATPAATRLKAAMEIVKLVQSQRPIEQAKFKNDLDFDRFSEHLHLTQVANAEPSREAETTPIPVQAPSAEPVRVAKEPVRNAPCPCGSRLKYKRCCGNPATPQSRAA